MADPVTLQILDALVAVMLTITPDAGYGNLITSDQVGYEPRDFDEASTPTFPQILIEEENSNITDSNARTFLEDAVFVISGFLTSQRKFVIGSAVQLRNDITVALIREGATKKHFVDGDGKPFVAGFKVKGQREIVTGEEAPPGCVQVKVRVSLSYSQAI